MIAQRSRGTAACAAVFSLGATELVGENNALAASWKPNASLGLRTNGGPAEVGPNLRRAGQRIFTVGVAFRAVVEELDFGRFVYRVVHLPAAAAAALTPRQRVVGSVAGIPFRGAVQAAVARGRGYLLLSAAFRREAGLRVGDAVEVRLELDDPARVDVPPDLAAAFRRNPAAARTWATLTPGRQRGLVHPLARARRPATREARLLALLEALADGPDALPGPPPRRTTPA